MAPSSPAEALAIAKRLASTADRTKGGPLQRAAERLRPPALRYQANGVIAGLLKGDVITTLDGETFGVELSPALRKWVERNPAEASAPSRWIVYPRTLPGGLAFYVVGQRRVLPGETEAQLNRQVDRFVVTGVITNSRGLRKQTCVRICRNTPTPEGKRHNPSWQVRLLFLAGLPPAPTKSWWDQDARIQCQRVGRELKILVIDKVGRPAVVRPIEIGQAVLPWPWKPSSQAIWRLCHREGLSSVPPWPCSEQEADQIISRYLKVMSPLLTDLAPNVLARQADRVDPAKREELASLGRHQSDLTRQWLAKTDRFLEGLSRSDREGLMTEHQLKQRLAMAMVVDLEGVFEVEGDRFWFEGWPVRGRTARILRESLPLVQEAPPAVVAPTKKGPPAVKPKDPDSLIDELHAQAEREGWTDPLLHLKLTQALDQLISQG